MLPSTDPIFDPDRLAAVSEILPGRLGDLEFDRLTDLASGLLNVPTCLISLVTAETQEFKGACGLPDAVAATRRTPLSHSFCKHTVSSGEILKVVNAQSDPRVADNPVIEEIGVKAYLGFPLVNNSGHVLGAFCMIDYAPREWTETEIDTVRDFAGLAVKLIESVAKESRTAAALDVIVHDLRSPLSGISLSSSVLMEQIELIPKQLQGFVKSIAASTESAGMLLDNFSASHNDCKQTFCEDPGALLGEVIERLQPLAKAKGMDLVPAIKGSRPLHVPSEALEQILENLISNALKYAPPATPVVVSLDCDETSGWFGIRDEGSGFSEEDRPRMFQRYRRLSAKPTGNENSTGIGLSIVKRLTGQHRGTLELVSPPGKGAEFKLRFPVW